MAGFCLPKKYSEILRQGVKAGGELDPLKLGKKTSAERVEAFKKLLGEDNAKEVNALFEKQLLLKDQRAAMRNWVNQLLSLNEENKKAIHDQINSLREVLNPQDEKQFLSSLAAKKLGAEVTASEAKEVFELSQKTIKAREALRADPDNYDTRMAYGNAKLDLLDRIQELKTPKFDATDWRSYYRVGVNILGAPRSIMSSVDLSAPFVQGWGSLSSKRFWEAFADMHRYFASEQGYRNLKAYIVSHPDYEIARSAKLGLTELGDDMILREENFQSNLPEELLEKFKDFSEKTTGYRPPINIFRASNRAFTGFLNYVRFNRYVDLLNAARLLDEDVRVGSQVTRDLAKIVNDATGRGAIGINDSKAHLGPMINTVLFAARKLSADINMFDPTQVFRMESSVARRTYFKNLAGSVLATGAIIGLFRAIGGDVELDPRSQDFGLIKLGKTKFDFTGGKRIYVRLWAQMLTGTKITPSGRVIDLTEHKFGAPTRGDVAWQYIRGKLSPMASATTDAVIGTDGIGQPTTLSGEAKDKLVPMNVGSFLDFANSPEKDTRAALTSLLTVYGVNMIPARVRQKDGLTMWGESVDSIDYDGDDILNKELDDLNYFDKPGHPAFPPKAINGVKLTDAQYHDYIMMSGSYAKQLLTPVVKSPAWSELPDTIKESLIKAYIDAGRQKAQVAIIQSTMHTPDDILRKSYDNKFNPKPSTYEKDSKKEVNKSAEMLLKTPVSSEEELKQQWADLMIKDYDYGRMKESNPLAYLGYLAVKDQGVARYFKTPTSALAITNLDSPDPKAEDYELVRKIMKEADIDPKSAKGTIMLGPEFAEGKNTYTLEHELMHRGMMELLKTGFKPKIGDHLMIQGYQHLYGNDKHSTELEADMMGNPLKQQYKNDEKAHKEFAETFKEDIDGIQNLARKLLEGKSK